MTNATQQPGQAPDAHGLRVRVLGAALTSLPR
jgi:hypothetical protein